MPDHGAIGAPRSLGADGVLATTCGLQPYPEREGAAEICGFGRFPLASVLFVCVPGIGPESFDQDWSDTMARRHLSAAWLAPCTLLLLASACDTADREMATPDAPGTVVVTAEPLPQKLDVEGFQAVLASTGDVYVGGQPSREALDWLKSEGVTTVVNLRTQPEMDNRSRVPYDEAAALKLIEFMTSPEQAAKWSIATGYMGVSPAAYETDALKAYTAEFPPALVARNQLENAVAEFSTFETARVRDGLNNAIQAALTGAKSPADALGEAQQAAVRLLRDYQ